MATPPPTEAVDIGMASSAKVAEAKTIKTAATIEALMGPPSAKGREMYHHGNGKQAA